MYSPDILDEKLEWEFPFSEKNFTLEQTKAVEAASLFLSHVIDKPKTYIIVITDVANKSMYVNLDETEVVKLIDVLHKRLLFQRALQTSQERNLCL